MEPEALYPARASEQPQPAGEALDIGRTAGSVRQEASADGPRGRLKTSARDGGMLGALVLVTVGALIFVHGFGTSYNIETLLRNGGFIGLVAVGMTFIVATGNFIDLSVVAQVASAAIVTTVLQRHGLALAMVGAVGICLVFAAVNWFGAGYLRANCVIVTLGVETAGLGMLEYATHGAAYSAPSQGLHKLMTGGVGPIPFVFVLLVVVAAVAQFVLARTKLGYALRAVGANRTAAALSGVRTDAVMAVAFVAVAISCALAGIALAGFNGGALSNMSEGYDFSALAAVIVGGNSLLGGEGSAVRTVVGVLFVQVLLNVLVVVGLPYTWQHIALGVIVSGAVAIDALLRRKQTT